MVKNLFNILSASSFALSGGIIASGVYVYANREAIIDDVKAQVIEAATEAITDQLPGLLDGAVPGAGGDLPLPGAGERGESAGGLPVPVPVVPF